MVHPESAKPMANGAIKLKLDICKARASLRRGLYFVRERWQIFGSAWAVVMKTHFEQFASHNNWANARLCQSAFALSSPAAHKPLSADRVRPLRLKCAGCLK